MSVPTHGPDCSTRTFQSKCKYCGDVIFFFSCTCGSRLIFNELGYPWPLHSCRDYVAGDGRYRLGEEVIPIAQLWNRGIRGEDLENALPGTLGSHFTDDNLMNLPDLIDRSIDKPYVQRVTNAAIENKSQVKPSTDIVRQDPYHDVHTSEIGQITELISDANIAKKAGIKRGSMGMSALGKWARQNLVQMTMHTGALGEAQSDNCSFTFFVEESVVKRHGIVRGCIVSARLRGIVISSRNPIWVCEELVDLYD